MEEAISENFEIAIFDDGLQDSTISYDLSLVCFNKMNWVGNGLMIPAGPLREDFKSIRNYENFFLNGNNENLDMVNTKQTFIISFCVFKEGLIYYVPE